MFHLTLTAGARLAELLTEAEAPAEVAIRLRPQPGGLALRLDRRQAGDVQFTHSGRAVLLLDHRVHKLLADCRLERIDALDGLELQRA